MDEKSRLIFEHEQRFADILAAKVISKPKLSIWMILIPLIFVYYMNDWQRAKDGRKIFADNFLLTKKRALEEAVAAVQTGRGPDPTALADLSEMQEEARQKLADLFAVLIDHYTALLRADGDTFEALVRSAYKNRTNYLLFYSRLNNAEKGLNATLKTQLSETTDGVNDIVGAIQKYSEELHRSDADHIFA